MTLENRLVLEMTYNSIVQVHNKKTKVDNIDWEKVFSIACRNNIAPCLFDQVTEINKYMPIDNSILQEWKQCTMYTSLMEYRKNFALRKILQKTDEMSLSTIIFKGPILANLYRNYALRTSCDTDILIKEEEKDKIFTVVEELGYKRELESEDNVYTFKNKEFDHILELHITLYGQHEGPRIDLLNSMNLTNTNSLMKVKACGIKCSTLGYQEQLIYLMFHLIKHFTLEGISLRHVIDIVLYINEYIDKISLTKFWDAMNILRYTDCCIAFFSVGVRYLGLDVRILNGLELEDEKICEDLLLDVMDHGLTEDSNTQIFQLWGILEPYMVGEVRKKQSINKNYLTLLKPIDKKYEYARKHKLLLPICWVHKIGSYIHSKYILRKGIYTPLEKVKVAENRIELLQEVGLIEKAK